MSNNQSNKAPVVFVHGLWMTAESWQPWTTHFEQRGRETLSAKWPGESETTEATRANADAMAGYGIHETADFIAEQFKSLSQPPILIGHSLGGLLVQNLLGRGIGSAAVAIDSAPIKGVPELPLAAIKASFPVLSNPGNVNKVVPLTEDQFRFAFANRVSEEEAKSLYETYHVPAPGKVLFQAGLANFNPNAQSKVNLENSTRGPLLFIAGEKDNTVPPVMVRSAFKRYQKKSTAVTEYKEFANRGHSLVVDSGWQELADYILNWLDEKGL